MSFGRVRVNESGAGAGDQRLVPSSVHKFGILEPVSRDYSLSSRWSGSERVATCSAMHGVRYHCRLYIIISSSAQHLHISAVLSFSIMYIQILRYANLPLPSLAWPKIALNGIVKQNIHALTKVVKPIILWDRTRLPQR